MENRRLTRFMQLIALFLVYIYHQSAGTELNGPKPRYSRPVPYYRPASTKYGPKPAYPRPPAHYRPPSVKYGQSTSHAHCWYIIKQTHIPGGKSLRIRNVHHCQAACISDKNCTAIEWDPFDAEGKFCRIHDTRNATAGERRPQSTLFHLNRVCLQQMEVKVCENSPFAASCESEPGTVLVIDTAVYERTRFPKLCLKSSIFPNRCTGDVKPYVERRCSGRRRCEMMVTKNMEPKLEYHKKCNMFRHFVLRVIYSCLQVYEGHEHKSCGNRSLVVNSSDAYLANVVTLESGRGSSSCPWNFTVSDGQAVTVTLLDFAAEDRPPTQLSVGNESTTCETYAILHLGNSEEPITNCGGGERERDVHSHTGKPDLVIAITGNSNLSTQQDVYFLLHVRMRCVEYESTEDYRVVQQASDTVLLQCVNENATRQIWTLRCVDGQWLTSDEQQLNCTSTTDQQQQLLDDDSETSAQSHLSGKMILLTVGLSLGLLVVVIGVMVGVGRYLRARDREENELD